MVSHRALRGEFGRMDQPLPAPGWGCGRLCGLAAGLLAFEIRFDDQSSRTTAYLVFSFGLPVLWLIAVGLVGGYDPRFVGVGADEFRRILNAGGFLTAAVAVICYAAKIDIARGYVAIALPLLTVLDLFVRFALRKQLHRQRRQGNCMRRVVVVGHADVVGDMTAMFGRRTGLSVVAACVAEPTSPDQVSTVPVVAGLARVADVVDRYGADTVAVLACPEMSGIRLRNLAWELEKTGTDLCVAPALLDVAGPRTTIRPVAGLPLLHMDHPEFSGFHRVLKEAFDRTFAYGAADLRAAAGHRGRGHPAGGPRPCPVPAGPDRPARPLFHCLQVPHDGARRRADQDPASSAQ